MSNNRSILFNTQLHYGLISILVHWTLAIILVGLFVSGVIMTGLDYYDPLYTSLPWWHKSFGLLVIFLFIFKLTWIAFNQKPDPLEIHKGWEISVAHLTHIVLILLIGLLCITGYIVTVAAGAGISFYDWFELPALFSVGETLEVLSGNLHWWFSLAGALVVSLHVAGAIKHAVVDRDGTLKRMFRLPGSD